MVKNDFRYSSLSDELCVDGLYLNSFNKMEKWVVKDPSKTITLLLETLAEDTSNALKTTSG